MIDDAVSVSIKSKIVMHGKTIRKRQHPVGTRIGLRLVAAIIRRRGKMAFDREVSDNKFNELLDYLQTLHENRDISYHAYKELHDDICDLYDSFEDAE